ncbi:MAG TPA: Rieske (2Fe-2S) protein [Nitrososphaeraceae archaeon]|nr:Rieske (2Fe-2S) protein [Nitrososphaeraceae archaeon]
MAKEGYQKAATKKDLPEGGLLKVEPQGRPIVLLMVDGKVYAMDAVCSHEGGPLEEGTLDKHNLTCPWHYAIFDVRNAKVSDQTVWATDLNSYQVEIDEESGDISIISRQVEKMKTNHLLSHQQKKKYLGLQNSYRSKEENKMTAENLLISTFDY